MRPGLNREIVRASTAYRVGRVAVDVLVVLQWIVAALLLAIYFQSTPTLQGPAGLMSFSIAVGSAVIYSMIAVVLRELAQAVFDLADCALLTQKGRGTSENPFGA